MSRRGACIGPRLNAALERCLPARKCVPVPWPIESKGENGQKMKIILKVVSVNQKRTDHVFQIFNWPKLVPFMFIFSIVLGSFLIFGPSKARAIEASDNFNR